MPWGAIPRRRSKDKIEMVGMVNRDFESTAAEDSSVAKQFPNKLSDAAADRKQMLSGAQGLCARVLERFEFQQTLSDGTPEAYVCQTVELSKRPGQTLGLFIREGNGLERSDGVFVSRLAEGSDIEKFNVLKIGDEILSVNNVDVSRMQVDDVVVMMSIPRRLVLKIRFPKQSKQPAIKPLEPRKPVVILKQSSRQQIARDGSRDSGLDDEIEASTAQTSLGAKTSQSQSSTSLPHHQQHSAAAATSRNSAATTSSSSERTPLLTQSTYDVSSPLAHVQRTQSSYAGSLATASQQALQLAGRHNLPQSATTSVINSSAIGAGQQGRGPSWLLSPQPLSAVDREQRIYQRNLAMHSPRVLDSHGRPLFNLNSIEGSSNSAALASNYGSSTVGNHLGRRGNSGPALIRRAESLRSDEKPHIFNNQSYPFATLSPRAVPRFQHFYGTSRDDYGGYLSSDCNYLNYQPLQGSGHLEPTYENINVFRHLPSNMQQFMQNYPQTAAGAFSSELCSSDSDSGAAGVSGSSRLPFRLKSALRQQQQQQQQQVPLFDGRQQPINFMSYPSDISALSYAAAKSNSLPRRRVGRVKWKNDLISGRPGHLAAMMQDAQAASDSDGAVSAPELNLSPGGFMFATARNGSRYAACREIDDIFTSDEYRAWMCPPGSSHNNHAGSNYATCSRSARGRTAAASVPYNSTCHSSARAGGAHLTRMHNSVESLTQPQSATITPFGLQSVSEGIWEHQYSTLPNGASIQCPPIPRLKPRSSSLPPRTAIDSLQESNVFEQQPMTNSHNSSPYLARRQQQQQQHQQQLFSYAQERSRNADRDRRQQSDSLLSSRAQQSATIALPLCGLLVIHIVEGRGLKIPEKRGERLDELYVVVEIDGEHRARTSVSSWEQKFAWDELFEIDVLSARQADFYIYSWHPQYRHKLCHRGCLRLLEVIVESTADRKFALNLEPRGQLMIKVSFFQLISVLNRSLALRQSAYFGVDLVALVQRENTGFDVPVVLKRLIEEIERRGVDSTGLYYICGSAFKKLELRNRLEKQPLVADISPETVPDINVLTGVVKDFLRELPEPLFNNGIYSMLLEAWSVCSANDKQGNVKLMLGVVDCLPRINKCSAMVLMDHFQCVVAHATQNNCSLHKLCGVFGPLLFCTAKVHGSECKEIGGKIVDFLDPFLAIRILAFLMDLWPTRNSSSESSSSDNSTVTATHNGERSLVDIWMQENGHRESHC